MISVDFTEEQIAGEPGPNLYYRGTPEDFLRLTSDLHQLGRMHGITLELNNLSYVDVLNGFSVTLSSSDNSKTLCKVNGKDITIDLDSALWRRLLEVFLRISFYPSHDYIDFEDTDILEDANLIVSSEANVNEV